MGRTLFLTALVLAVTALTGCGDAAIGSAVAEGGHRGVACAACHEFVDGRAVPSEYGLGALLADPDIQNNTTVPSATCSVSGCHDDGRPERVAELALTVAHPTHWADSLAMEVGCVACHTHQDGGAPLDVARGSCSLCHISEAAEGNAGECRLCHTEPNHVAFTSQNVAIPHQDVPSLDGGCVRCHYDVSPVPVEVSVLACADCHESADSLARASASVDPHLDHTEIGCARCHQDQGHEVRALSSAVALECGDCHGEIHGVEPEPTWPGTETCNACHGEIHAPEQALLLGMVAGVPGSRPSEKFMDGLSCRSCHVASPAHDPQASLNGSVDGCVGCHRAEYGEVLDWWVEGSSTRVASVRRVVDRAVERLAGNAAAAPRLDSALAALTAVEEGGAVHNLPLSHELLQRAQDQLAQAYRDGGGTAPAMTDLGSEPRMGLCTYCHYRSDDEWAFQEMSGEFHREALRRTR